MALCKIYLFTYKRPSLLPRAIQSLCNQTFCDWTCDVHNDDPNDLFPEQYIKSLNDNRFVVKNHNSNLGATKSFNLAFEPCQETFISILEDDNWWEETFLQRMIDTLEKNHHVNMAWTNMFVWKETIEGFWENTNTTVWPIDKQDTLFLEPNDLQAMGALHSNGAMMFRSKDSSKYIIPNVCDFNIMEAVRERTYAFPILLVNDPLANYAITRETTREKNSIKWTSNQVLLLTSFINASEKREEKFNHLLKIYRDQIPTPIANFFLCNIFYLKNYKLYFFFNFKDWFNIIKWLIKNVANLKNMKAYLASQKDLYIYLLEKTSKRFFSDPKPEKCH
ncbi:glycosyltransferase family 2 protein [Pedobacter agri]|uniref:glycosyltransferase family 2 protein n=1 Tax=Pedobacter agri TaxID=454586 RepID=UPI00292E3C75|nr:glycosyltransferase [Pedobacter agri]